MSWTEMLHLVPTRNREVLASLIGGRIVRLAHLAEAPAELLVDESYVAQSIGPERLFSVASGPIVLVVEQHRPLYIVNEAPLMSVTMEFVDPGKLEADWAVAIEADDPTYSESKFANMLGKRIAGIRVLQRFIDPDRLTEGNQHFFPMALDRPREAALVLVLENADELVFSTGLVQAPDDFAVVTGAELDASSIRCVEILRLP
jgi:hypothetical protein